MNVLFASEVISANLNPVIVLLPDVAVPASEIVSPVTPTVPEDAVLVIEDVEPAVASVAEENTR